MDQETRGIIWMAVSVFILFRFPSMTEQFKVIEKKPSFINTITAITWDSNQINALWARFILVLAHFMIIAFIPTMFITTMGENPLWYGLIFTTLFFIFASSRMISPNTIITASAPTANRGSFMSIKSALQQFAIFLSAMISGMIVVIEDGKYDNYMWVGLLSVLFGILSIFLVKRLKVAQGN